MSKTDFQNGFILGLASKGRVIQAGVGDYTEAYNLMTKEAPVEDTESGIVDYIGALVGVNANDNN